MKNLSSIVPPLPTFDLSFYLFLMLRIQARGYITFYAVSLQFFAFKADNNKQVHLEKVNRKRLNTG